MELRYLILLPLDVLGEFVLLLNHLLLRDQELLPQLSGISESLLLSLNLSHCDLAVLVLACEIGANISLPDKCFIFRFEILVFLLSYLK